MKAVKFMILFSLILISACISKFIPETDETNKVMVVEGVITDQQGEDTIKLLYSTPLGKIVVPDPVRGAKITITDDYGRIYPLTEKASGIYCTDSKNFRGAVGRTYTLRIQTKTFSYISTPMKMNPVPPIDSVYYEKKLSTFPNTDIITAEGCQIYLNSYDPSNKCQYFRWTFSETWVFMLPYSVPNSVCWLSDRSNKINIKSTAAMQNNRIVKHPLNFISNETDRLKVKYSILVSQYSLNQSEYDYWEKLQSISERVGGLYDITPMSVPSNIHCNEDASQKVLGYFSVSAMSQKRIFIKDNFTGFPNLYVNCPSDTIYGGAPIPGLGVSVWVIIDNTFSMNPNKIVTTTKGCADCTVRGTRIKPDFWKDDD